MKQRKQSTSNYLQAGERTNYFGLSTNMMIVCIQFIQSKMWFTDANHFPFQKRPVVNLTYIQECFPGRVNITVVAESRQSSACPKGATDQQNLNWKDTVVKSLLVEVCACNTIKLFQIRNRLNMRRHSS